ncbi:MAG TPA: hypothetical protein VF669_18435 [Tepidisphaeraceae bacterium]|jgi:hypothetical protein
MEQRLKTFWVADLNVQGELSSQAEYTYDALDTVAGQTEMIPQFSAALWRDPDEFETKAPWAPSVTLRWAATAPTAGIATIRCGGELASVSLLCTGKDPNADRVTLEAYQRFLLQQLHGTQTEPAFALLELTKRPLVATINFLSPPEERERVTVALADRCFAASYFRYHQLA